MRVLTKGAVLSGALSLLLSCATAHAGSWDVAEVNVYTSTDDYNSQGMGDTGPCYSASTSGESVTTSAHDSITSTGPYATASTEISTADWGLIFKSWKWNSDGSYDYPESVHAVLTGTYNYAATSSATGDSSTTVGSHYDTNYDGGFDHAEYEAHTNDSGSRDYAYNRAPCFEYRYFGSYDEDGNYIADGQDGLYAEAVNGAAAFTELNVSGNNGTAQASLDQSASWTLDLETDPEGGGDPEQ